MKEVYQGYLKLEEFDAQGWLMFRMDDGAVHVETLFEEFVNHPRIQITIEDIREPKERVRDYVARVSAVSLKDIEVVPQHTMAAPI